MDRSVTEAGENAIHLTGVTGGAGKQPRMDRTGGLTTAEAAQRLARDGPNLLPSARRPSMVRQFVAELTHFFAALFWVAAALAFVAGMPQLGVAVIVVILLNGSFAFAEQLRAEHAAERLRSLLPRRATVRRDGQTLVIDAEDLVEGDLLLLAGGDQLSADGVILEAHGVAVDVSTLTGESRSEHPVVGDALFAGCFVVEGEGRATVTATGGRTRLASIAGLTRRARPSATPLRRELDRISRIIALMAVGVGTVFFGLSLLVGTPASDGFLFAVGVTVAVVPSGLLPALTLSLAVGAQRMAGKQALIRNLESVETLGSTTFICTDKTGTLTRNEMSVVSAWTPLGVVEFPSSGYEPRTSDVDALLDEAARAAMAHLARVARLCSTGRIASIDGRWTPQGDPMEAAIDCFARRVRAEPSPGVVLARLPFDPRRRRMSVVVDDMVALKGAPDAVLPLCVEPIRDVHRLLSNAEARRALEAFTARGLRVLAVAERSIDGDDMGAEDLRAEVIEQDLRLVGLLAFEDPPRAEAADALIACRRAGVKVAMVTGDHPATALAIAHEVGLALDDSPAFIGGELPADDGMLAALVDRDGVVIARVDPEDKLRIARVLGERGHVVAMTGDGVNDAPALRMAAIGIAMGRSGTDVAREAADLVLLDDDFATIVTAIEQGRSTFSNIRRFLTFHLAVNVAELTPFLVWALSGGRFPLALGVLQILALDLVADIPPSLALGAEPPAAHVLDRPPTRRHLIEWRLIGRSFLWLGPAEATWVMTTFVLSLMVEGWRVGQSLPGGDVELRASGAAFTALVLAQVANAFACRSTRLLVWQLSVRRNALLLWAIGSQLVLCVAFLVIAPVARVLHQAPPTLAGTAVALLAVPLMVIVDTLQKQSALRRQLRRLVRPRP